MTDEEMIWVCAFRYAIGRKTYIVSVVCDWLKSHKLSNHAKRIIIEEIEQAERTEDDYFKTLGDDCDKKRWLKLKDILEEKIK